MLSGRKTYKSREKPPAPSASCQELEPAASSEYPTPSPLDYFPESILPCSPVIRAEVPVLPESIRADSTVLLDTRVGIPAEQVSMLSPGLEEDIIQGRNGK
jgi:hypothetical protein